MATSNSHLLRWSGNAMVGRGKKALKKSDIEFAPSIDQVAFYDPPRERSASPPEARFVTNIGHKQHPNARFARRGKMYAWGPAYEDVQDEEHVRKRMRLCLEEFMPEAAKAVKAECSLNVVQSKRVRAMKLKEEQDYRAFTLPHLRSPSPPLVTEDLTPMLAIPQTYVDIMISPSMRHTLGDDSMEQGLQRTASDLLESEKPLMQSLGRLKDIFRLLERDVPEAKVEEDKEDGVAPGTAEGTGGDTSTNGEPSRKKIPALPHVSDTDNLWRVTQELLQTTHIPTISYQVSDPETVWQKLSKEEVDAIELTPMQRLFTHPNGITITATPPSSHPYAHLDKSHPSHPRSVQYDIDLEKQVTAVDDAMERIHELLADCNEYKIRLEEARDRLADVARVRKKVWSIIKERAGGELDKYDGRSADLVG